MKSERIGAWFESLGRLLKEEEQPPVKHSPVNRMHQEEIRNVLLVLSADVIRVDKRMNTATEDYLAAFISKQFGPAQVEDAIRLIHQYVESGTEAFVKISCTQLTLLATHGSLLQVVEFLFGLAAADDFIHAKEVKAIQRIARYLKISDRHFTEIKHRFQRANNPYAVLGLDEDAPLSAVKSAYRKLVLKFHPDKRESHVSETEARIKFLEIRMAYEKIVGESSAD